MVKPNTKVVSITHPNNPSGSVITEQELQELCDFCAEKDIYLLSDETYRDMTYLTDPPPAACTLYDKAISITSMSKCYGMPGARVGWLASKDKHLMEEVLVVRECASPAGLLAHTRSRSLTPYVFIDLLRPLTHDGDGAYGLCRRHHHQHRDW